jgi:ankyrin repeat protein
MVVIRSQSVTFDIINLITPENVNNMIQVPGIVPGISNIYLPLYYSVANQSLAAVQHCMQCHNVSQSHSIHIPPRVRVSEYQTIDYTSLGLVNISQTGIIDNYGTYSRHETECTLLQLALLSYAQPNMELLATQPCPIVEYLCSLPCIKFDRYAFDLACHLGQAANVNVLARCYNTRHRHDNSNDSPMIITGTTSPGPGPSNSAAAAAGVTVHQSMTPLTQILGLYNESPLLHVPIKSNPDAIMLCQHTLDTLVNEHKFDINVQDRFGHDLLYKACRMRSISLVRHLTHIYSCDPHRLQGTHSESNNCLHTVCTFWQQSQYVNPLDIIKFLAIESKVSFNVQDSKGRTPMMMLLANITHFHAVFEFICSQPALLETFDVTITDHIGRNLVHYAMELDIPGGGKEPSDRPWVLDWFLADGPGGEDALSSLQITSCRLEHKDCAFTRYWPSLVGAQDALGNTPLHYACKNGLVLSATRIIKHCPASLFVHNEEGDTPIVILAKYANDLPKFMYSLIHEHHALGQAANAVPSDRRGEYTLDHKTADTVLSYLINRRLQRSFSVLCAAYPSLFKADTTCVAQRKLFTTACISGNLATAWRLFQPFASAIQITNTKKNHSNRNRSRNEAHQNHLIQDRKLNAILKQGLTAAISSDNVVLVAMIMSFSNLVPTSHAVRGVRSGVMARLLLCRVRSSADTAAIRTLLLRARTVIPKQTQAIHDMPHRYVVHLPRKLVMWHMYPFFQCLSVAGAKKRGSSGAAGDGSGSENLMHSNALVNFAQHALYDRNVVREIAAFLAYRPLSKPKGQDIYKPPYADPCNDRRAIAKLHGIGQGLPPSDSESDSESTAAAASESLTDRIDSNSCVIEFGDKNMADDTYYAKYVWHNVFSPF